MSQMRFFHFALEVHSPRIRCSDADLRRMAVLTAEMLHNDCGYAERNWRVAFGRRSILMSTWVHILLSRTKEQFHNTAVMEARRQYPNCAVMTAFVPFSRSSGPVRFWSPPRRRRTIAIFTCDIGEHNFEPSTAGSVCTACGLVEPMASCKKISNVDPFSFPPPSEGGIDARSPGVIFLGESQP